VLLAPAGIDRDRLVGKPGLFEKQRHLGRIWRAAKIESRCGMGYWTMAASANLVASTLNVPSLSSGLPAQGFSLSIVAVYLGERGRPARSLANDLAFGNWSSVGDWLHPWRLTSGAAGLLSFSQ
jgi:hypothetical protein